MLVGKVNKLGLGTYPQISLAEARKVANVENDSIQAGKDPAIEKAKKAAVKHADTVANALGDRPETVEELGAKWLGQYASKKHADTSYATAVFTNHINPILGQVRLELLRARHVSGLLDSIHATGKSRTCGVVLSTIRQAVQWGMTREYLPGDVTAGLKGSEWGGKGEMRTRTLKDDEIKLLYHLVNSSSLAPRWRHAVWLILSCGTRVEETLLAEVKHVDLVKNEWLIPAENQKQVNRKSKQVDHTVQLSPFALAQMSALIALANDGKGRYLFPSRVQIDGVERSANEKTLSHIVGDRQTDKPQKGRTQQSDELVLHGGHWTPHDLRRTLATQMGELGVIKDVINRCINHTIGDISTQTYQHQELRTQMLSAWDAWGAKLKLLISEAAADRTVRQLVLNAAKDRLAKQESARTANQLSRARARAKLAHNTNPI
jgi:integrase